MHFLIFLAIFLVESVISLLFLKVLGKLRFVRVFLIDVSRKILISFSHIVGLCYIDITVVVIIIIIIIIIIINIIIIIIIIISDPRRGCHIVSSMFIFFSFFFLFFSATFVAAISLEPLLVEAPD